MPPLLAWLLGLVSDCLTMRLILPLTTIRGVAFVVWSICLAIQLCRICADYWLVCQVSYMGLII